MIMLLFKWTKIILTVKEDIRNQKSGHYRNSDEIQAITRSFQNIQNILFTRVKQVSHVTQMKYLNHLFITICGIQSKISQPFIEIQNVFNIHCVRKRSTLKSSTLRMSWTNIDLCKFSGA